MSHRPGQNIEGSDGGPLPEVAGVDITFPAGGRAMARADKAIFVCGVCGDPTLIAPADGSPAVCPEHCEDHQYIYEAGEGHLCGNCGARPPDDWFDIC